MSIAEDLAERINSSGQYERPLDSAFKEKGGRLLESSNDGSSSYSHSPTDIWEFPDGSKVQVSYSQFWIYTPSNAWEQKA